MAEGLSRPILKVINIADMISKGDYSQKIHEKMKLIIAADLHDIGKLAVPNDILGKPDKLSDEEFSVIKKHPDYTRLALQEIKGFENIKENNMIKEYSEEY